MTAEIRRSRPDELLAALRVALPSVGIEQHVCGMRRRRNMYESSHRGDVVTCELEDGSKLKLLCKYGHSEDRNRFGLKRGLRYEDAVYRHLLGELGDAAPRFHGSCHDPQRGLTWLFLEYLGQGWRLDWGPPEVVLAAAAETIGGLHRRMSENHELRALEVLNRYDRRYLCACMEQALASANRMHEKAPAIECLAEHFRHEMEVLLAAPQTVIHGEYTPHNVLWINERPRILDWEEAAIGAGEIDLACLTDEWEPELVEMANAAYVRARWPDGPPHDFPRTLAAARLYWLFRWLGDSEDAELEDATEWIEWIADHLNEVDAAHGLP